jgi:glutamate-1-semialdehyde 2,1-aminomutase
MLAAELFWLFSTNRGVLTPPGLDEQWLVSLLHTEEALDVYLDQLSEICDLLSRRCC